MIYTNDQILDIIKTNPAKKRLDKARAMSKKLLLHLHGIGMEEAIEHCDYFENPEIYKVRKKYAVSNKDLYSRLLQSEDMVYTATGGSSIYNLSEEKEKVFSALLNNVSYELSLRKWMKLFALEAFRSDPMGVILMEIGKKQGDGVKPKAYPTYKSSFTIFNYDTTGRRLEHICFQLTVSEAIEFGVTDPDFKELAGDKKTLYFRFIDDAKDAIYKYDNDMIVEIGKSIPNYWKKTPGFIVSNRMVFNDPKCFVSPLDNTIELADSFLNDRSIRDIQKRLHGFAKAVEPIIDCPTCDGEKFVNGMECKTCGGAGYNKHTKVSDVARFPLALMETSFDFKRIFGYVTPDVEGWEKQDSSLVNLESLIEQTYWGTVTPKQTAGPSKGGSLEETATKTLTDLQPKYARLNEQADWGERTEAMVADYIGKYEYTEFTKSDIAYGRYYVLETPSDLWSLYQDMRSKGAPEATLYETIEKYYHSLYKNSPIERAVRIKLLYVEPFPHMGVAEVKAIATDPLDVNCKLYFGEWYSTMANIAIIRTSSDKLREALRVYVQGKNLPAPPEPAKPGFGN